MTSFHGNVVEQLAATMSAKALAFRIAILEATHWGCASRRDDRFKKRVGMDIVRPFMEAYKIVAKREAVVRKAKEEARQRAMRAREAEARAEGKPIPIVIKARPAHMGLKLRKR